MASGQKKYQITFQNENQKLIIGYVDRTPQGCCACVYT